MFRRTTIKIKSYQSFWPPSYSRVCAPSVMILFWQDLQVLGPQNQMRRWRGGYKKRWTENLHNKWLTTHKLRNVSPSFPVYILNPRLGLQSISLCPVGGGVAGIKLVGACSTVTCMDRFSPNFPRLAQYFCVIKVNWGTNFRSSFIAHCVASEYRPHWVFNPSP